MGSREAATCSRHNASTLQDSAIVSSLCNNHAYYTLWYSEVTKGVMRGDGYEQATIQATGAFDRASGRRPADRQSIRHAWVWHARRWDTRGWAAGPPNTDCSGAYHPYTSA